MRSGRGKCPQCKETIVVDLDAEEIRCPFCNALLKKSAKSVAEVRAEQEKERAEKEAAAAAAAAAVAATEPAPVEEPVVAEQPAPAPEPVAPTEEALPEKEPEVRPAEEKAEEPVDEIGISDEELAMLDETPAGEMEAETPATEEAEAVDEIGISDEELAMMDEAPVATEEAPATNEEAAPEEIPVDDVFSDQAPEAAPAASDDETFISGSIGADPDEETPEEADAERIAAEDNGIVIPDEDDAPVNNNVTLEDDIDPALLDDELPATLEDSQEEAAPEAPAAENEAPVEEVAPAEEAPAEEPALEVEEPEVPAEQPALEVEEPVVESAPEAPAEEPAPAEAPAPAPVEEPAPEEPAYTEEDMAFAASLSETGRKSARVGFVAPAKKEEEPKPKKKSERKPKEAAPEGEKSMRGSSVYKKPVALIMTILAILAAAFWFLYYKAAVLLLIPGLSAETLSSLFEKLPALDPLYVIAAFAGVIAVVSILGLTGKKGKLGFLFLLLADVVFALVSLFGATPLFEVEALQNIVADYGEYASYAIYGLLALGAVFFAVGLVSGKDDYDLAGGAAILPILYLAVVVAGYVALILLPKFIEFTVTADILRYAILGVIGAALLMTFVGVHNGSLSRAVNGWLIFAAVAAIALVNVAAIVIEKVLVSSGKVLDLYPTFSYFITPIIAIFGVAGFAAADMRN